jgi:hypothetical protein
VQGIAPISGQQGITSLAKPIVPNTNDNANTNTNYSNNFNQDPNAKSMYSNYYMDNLGFGDIFGGISGLASKAMGYPSLGYAVAANNNLGLDFSGFSPGGGRGMAYGASNYSGAVDTGDFGREADNVSNGGVSASEAGMGDGMSDLAKGGRAGTDGYANGGRIGYAVGGTGRSPDAAETYSEYKARMLEALRKSHGGQKTASTDLQPDGSYSGVSREIPIEDYFNYMLADAYALGFNPNTGLKFGVDDRGVLTDQYKFKQEMADFKKNSQTTPTEDFRDNLNTSSVNTIAQTTPETPTEDFSDYLNTSSVNTIAQTTPETPTEDFSDYLNTSSVNTIAQTTPETPTEDFSDYLNTPTIAEQIMSPDDSMNQDIDATNAGIPDSNLFQKGLTALTPAAQLAKGILGIGGTPITQSMETSLQDIIQNQIKETGNLSGNIDYNDYGVQTSSGAEYLGLGDKSSTDPQAALARTLGRASYAVDPQTGKVNFTGGTDYDFGYKHCRKTCWICCLNSPLLKDNNT